MPYQVIDNDGAALDAHLDINGADLVFHSRGGSKSDPDAHNLSYGPGLRLLLGRIREADIPIVGAWVDSDQTRRDALPESERIILDGAGLAAPPAEQFRIMSSRMKAVGRPPGAGDGGSPVKKIRIRLGHELAEGRLADVLGIRWDPRDRRSRERLPTELLNRVTSEDVHAAVRALLADPQAHAFGESRDFDLLAAGGARLPPKAVFGRAATARLGFPVLPRHFSSGPSNPAFRILQAAGYRIVPKAVEAGEQAGGSAPPVLAMLTDLSMVDASFEHWLAALEDLARPLSGQCRWLAAETIMFSPRPSARRQGVWDVELGVHASGEPWTVQLNTPAAAADANGLTTVAQDAQGRRYLIRQGWLRRNPDSDGEVRGARFRALSGLTPVNVSGGTTPTPREWYIVAELDAPPETIRRQTGAFVHACAQARLKSRGVVTPPASPPLTGADEKGGTVTRKAIEARPQREVRRLQGEVWLALRGLLERHGVGMIKLRHLAGYEVDGVILSSPRRILLEIKTAASASDVYEGVGQLMLYAEMLDLKDHDRALLLPAMPSATLRAAAQACRLQIHDYELEEVGDDVQVTFSDAFLTACGVPAASRSEGRN